MNPTLVIFQLVVLLFSAIVHEVSHGAMALRLGDRTAKDLGRLTLNPLKHLDPFGSVFLPIMLKLIGSPVLFGWAKPVPYNPLNLKNIKKDSGLIALAGPASNFSIAIIFGIFLRGIIFFDVPVPQFFPVFMSVIILINLFLGVFNLVPIPPLDGSKVLFAILPARFAEIERALEQYGMFILLFFLFFGIRFLFPIVKVIYDLIGGIPLELLAAFF